MLDARIVASSTQSLVPAAQSPATRTDRMVSSSHGLGLALGPRNCPRVPILAGQLSLIWADNALTCVLGCPLSANSGCSCERLRFFLDHAPLAFHALPVAGKCGLFGGAAVTR